MQGEQSRDARQFAVLIGINAYPEKPLKGCVRDVETIKAYLDKTFPNAQIRVLTANTRDDLDSCPSTADLERWPTYENVTSSLENVTLLGKPGDSVYIHYSGHGTRMEPSCEHSNNSTGDLALDLLEEPPRNGVRYLPGLELAYFLERMVAKKLTLALVLDCCFSGSVLRQDRLDSFRYLDYDVKVDLRYPRDPLKSPANAAVGSVSRVGSMLSNWLIDPRGYTILSACGPHEIAKELRFEDGQKQGALSYLLLHTLTKLKCFPCRQQEIHQQLCATFQQNCSSQHPMLYGSKTLSLLSGPIEKEGASRLVVVPGKQGDIIFLQAGCAHGYSDGDQLALSPFYSTDRTFVSGIEDRLLAYITRAGPLTSNLEILDRSLVPNRVQTGWIASPLRQLSLRVIPIWLASNVPNIEQWLFASEHGSLAVFFTLQDKQPFSFRVSLSTDDEYEIGDRASKHISSVPTLRRGQETRVLEVLSHLVRFAHVRELSNSSQEKWFRESFKVRLANRSGEIFDVDQLIDVRHGDLLQIIAQNKGHTALYLHIYDLGSCWQIENLLHGEYEVLPPLNTDQGFTGTTRRKLRMTIPSELQEQGQREYEDIIKVFVTNRPTSFTSLELPTLRSLMQTSTVAMNHAVNSSSRDGAGQSKEDYSEAWDALNFPIRIRIG